MSEPTVQYVSSENGEVTSVLVPIGLWREIGVQLASSPKTPSHPLLLGGMRQRLLKARKRAGGMPLDDVLRQFGLDRE